MKITTKLALKYINKNKKRSISCITGITLATILIISVLIVISSYQQYIINITRKDRNYEAELLGITYANAKEIEKDSNIKDVSIMYDMGTSTEDFVDTLDNFSETLRKTASVKINLTAYNEEAIKNNHITLEEGRFPKNSSEIVISDAMNYMKYIAIGEEIELTINGTKNKYIVVGRAEKLNNDYQAPFDITFKVVAGALTYFDEQEVQDNAKVNILVNTNNISKISTTVNNLVNKLDLYKTEQEKTEKIIYNRPLLNYSLVNYDGKENKPAIKNERGYSEEFEEDITKVVIGTMVLIAISSITVIYTVFKMSYQERVRELGVLTSLGMNKKQKTKMLLKESIILGTIGIILGIIIGSFISLFIVQLIDILFKKIGESTNGDRLLINSAIKMYMVIPFKVISLTTVLTYIITIISSLLPMRKINKISPIEAIRNIDNDKIKAKGIKTPRLVTKIFKQEGELAYKNIRRDKTKYKTIVISILISFITFIAVNTILENHLETYNQSIDNSIDRKEWMIPLTSFNDEYGEKLIEKLEQRNLIKKYLIVGNIPQKYKPGMSEVTKILDTDKINRIKKLNEDGELKIEISIVKGTEYKEILKQLGLTKLGANEGILIDTIKGKTKYGTDVRTTNYNVGDTLTFEKKYVKNNQNEEIEYQATSEQSKKEEEVMNELAGAILGQAEELEIKSSSEDSQNQTNVQEAKTYKLKIAGILNYAAEYSTISSITTNECTIIISEETIKAWDIDDKEISGTMYIDTDEPYEVEKVIKETNIELGTGISGFNFYDREAKGASEGLIKRIVVYSLITLIALLSAVNIFNTISTSLNLRKREFAELKSLGMSNKQINKMLFLEGIFYGLDAVIYGVLIGIALLYVIYVLIIDTGWNMKPFVIPIGDFTICIVMVYIIIFASIGKAKKKIKIQNIIDEVRNELE